MSQAFPPLLPALGLVHIVFLYCPSLTGEGARYEREGFRKLLEGEQIMEEKTVEEKIVRAYRRPEKQALAKQMRQEMTPSEKRLWERLRANRLNGLSFRRQQVISGFIADFYCRSARLVIECDGQAHAAQLEYDRERDRIISTYNLRVLRFANDQISNDIQSVLAAIGQAASQTTHSKALP